MEGEGAQNKGWGGMHEVHTHIQTHTHQSQKQVNHTHTMCRLCLVHTAQFYTPIR